MSAALTDARNLETLRGLEAGSGAGSASEPTAASYATYDTLGGFASVFETVFRSEAAFVFSEAVVVALPELVGKSAAAAGVARQTKQPIKSIATVNLLAEQ